MADNSDNPRLPVVKEDILNAGLLYACTGLVVDGLYQEKISIISTLVLPMTDRDWETRIITVVSHYL